MAGYDGIAVGFLTPADRPGLVGTAPSTSHHALAGQGRAGLIVQLRVARTSG
jgi:hypothetical protein